MEFSASPGEVFLLYYITLVYLFKGSFEETSFSNLCHSNRCLSTRGQSRSRIFRKGHLILIVDEKPNPSGRLQGRDVLLLFYVKLQGETYNKEKEKEREREREREMWAMFMKSRTM